MKQLIYASVICTVAFTACTTPFKKMKDMPGGMEYKVIGGNGTKVAYGNFVELAVTQAYGDSILMDGGETPTQIAVIDSMQLQKPYMEVFKTLSKGDSVVFKQSTDSLMKMNPNLPPFMKKGKFVYTRIKVKNIFTKKEQADSCQMAQMNLAKTRDSIFAVAQVVKDSKLIDEYLAKNKITNTVKGKQGTYVQILDAGTGAAVDTGMVAFVNYTGRLFDGSAPFDSNTDTAFKHVEPYPVVISQPEVVAGWVDGLKLLKKGAKAKFFIPSALGYGKRGRDEKIGPNANLMFDIEVVDVQPQKEFLAKMQQQQMQMEAMQRAMQQQQAQQQAQQGAAQQPKK
jgi:FKBP-type peptidyl-prolyl cis-trans isomerase FkpA